MLLSKDKKLTHRQVHKVEVAKVAVIEQDAVTIKMQAHRHKTRQRSERGTEESADDQFAVRVMFHFAAELLVVDDQTEVVCLVLIVDGKSGLEESEGDNEDIASAALRGRV